MTDDRKQTTDDRRRSADSGGIVTDALLDAENRKLGVLAGLAEEAALLGPAVMRRCSAADPRAARRLMAELIAEGATHCLSFGFAGGLEPGLPSGTIVIGSHIAGRSGVWNCWTPWVTQLAADLPGAQVGGIRGHDAIIAAPADKAELYRQTHCLAVDMESHIAAEMAASAGLPFAALRVICDPAEFALPVAALLPLKAGGKPALGAILHSVLCRPWQTGALLRLGRHHRRARHGLMQAASVL